MIINKDQFTSTIDSIDQAPSSQTRRKHNSLSIHALKKNNQKRTYSYFSPNITISKIQPLINYQQIFQKNTKKLIIILSFFQSLSQYSKEKLRLRIQYSNNQINLFPLYPDLPLIIRWNQFIQILLFIFSLLFPIQLAEIISINILLLIIDYIFIFEIILNLVTAYVDDNYNLEKRFKSIFLHYLKTWLIFDLISIIPDYQNQFQLLKFSRIIKYFIKKPIKNYKGQIFTQNNDSLQQDNKIYLSDGWIFLLNVILNAFLLIHIFGCLQIYYQNENYITSIYWASQTLFTEGYGDIKQNFSLSVIWIIISIGYYSVKIGDFAKLLMISNISITDDQCYLFDRLAYKIQMPENLREQVQQYYRTNKYYNQLDEDIEINELPKQLQIYLIISLKLDICRQIPFFICDINHTYQLLQSSCFRVYERDELIFRKGQISDEIYYLISGNVSLVTNNKYNLITIMEGTLFGEFEVINEQLRITFAIAKQRSLVLIVKYNLFRKCFKESKIINFEVSQLYARRKQLILNRMKQERIDLDRLKRKNVFIFTENDLSPVEHQKKLLQTKLQSINQYNEIILKQMLGKVKQQQLAQRFRNCVNHVINLLRQITITPYEDWKDLNEYQIIIKLIPQNYRRVSQLMQFSNYFITIQKEIRIQNKIKQSNKLSQQGFLTLKQIINKKENQYFKYNIKESQYKDKIKQKDKNIINQKILQNLQQFKIDLINIQNKWLEGSVIKFDLYKQLIHN